MEIAKVRFLNMARRLRPTTFAELKGQEFSLSMLKNSLYSNTFFPVYLFTGQRGCGKTTSGRIFAAALNCQGLTDFQKNPKFELPCKVCESCLMMTAGTHPDYVEMDAASHTGVDDVRAMLDAATYAPLHGTRKIYLIDEAHMLSKSAFNALLKMLEEPPKTALFMLATTELSKVPITVRSRCFQVHFMPFPPSILADYLKEIAQKEAIEIDDAAINAIVHASESCVRDALNLFEQISFATKTITQEAVHQALGMLPKNHFFALITPALNKNPEQLLDALSKYPLSLGEASGFFHLLVDFFRALIRLSYDVQIERNIFTADHVFLATHKNLYSLKELHLILQMLWEVEGLMGTSHQKHLILEHFLLKLVADDFSSFSANKSLLSDSQGSNKSISTTAQKVKNEQPLKAHPTPFIRKAETTPSFHPLIKDEPITQIIDSPQKKNELLFDPRWAGFVEQIKIEQGLMLASIFMQAAEVRATETGRLLLVFSVKSGFFKEKIAELKNQWHPIFLKCFNDCLDFEVTEKIISPPSQPIIQSKQNISNFTQNNGSNNGGFIQSNQSTQSTQSMIFKSPNEWPKANELLKAFPGTIEVVSVNDQENGNK